MAGTSASLHRLSSPERSTPRLWLDRSRVLLKSHGRDPSSYLLAAVVLVLLGAASAFADLSEDYLTKDPIVRWDVEFAAWLHAHALGPAVAIFKVVTLAGNVAVLAALTLGASVYVLRRGTLNEALLVLFVAVGVEALDAGLKLAFHRPRPRLAYTHLDTYSFPSGHTAGAVALYGVLALLIARRGGPRRWIACGVLFLAVVVVIGFSRLYLEAHYLSDVLAGAALGLLWLSACVLVFLLAGGRSALSLVPPRLRPFIIRMSAGR
jgi:undecaprenyl-diphosphatase